MSYKHIYLFIILISFAVGLFNFKGLNKGGRILTIYLLSVFITETLCIVFFKKNNLLEYIIGCSFQYSLVLLYFNESFSNIRKRKLGLILAPASLGFFFIYAYLNNTPIRKVYEYLVLMEGFFIISFCLMAYYYLLVKDMSTQILRVFDFWVISLFFLSWSINYFYWGFSGIIFKNKNFSTIYTVVLTINCLVYFAFGPLLYLSKKKKLGTSD